MRLKLLACEILFRECCHFISASPHRIDVEFLSKGLHDLGRVGMRKHLEERIASLDTTAYDAILLGYALCSGGVVGLCAPDVPIVIPKAHDCITLFLGSRSRYMEYFNSNPGTYFKTSGWIERGSDLVQLTGKAIDFGGRSFTLEQMIERYGEENALYVWDELAKMQHYSKLAFITTGIEPNDSFEKETEQLALEKNWKYEKIEGDLSLLEKMFSGDWDENFLIVPPGKRIEFDYTDEIVRFV